MFRKERFGFEGRQDRFFERGDLKYVILDLLEEKPSHGYEIIRALEERFGGFYAPSPGAVYPTLQLLEDLGYVTVVERDGKKVYTITEEGRAFLREREDVVDEILGRLNKWWTVRGRDELRETMRQLKDLSHELRHGARGVDADKLRRVREVVIRARDEIEAILRE